MKKFDLIIIGAGAAGLFCASVAGQRGARVALIDHSEKLAEKIRISGGGRCNFTNVDAGRPERFVSSQPRFARDALRIYPPRRFIDLVQQYRIAFHEKHRGQLFCDQSSEQIINLLKTECERGGVTFFRPVQVSDVRRSTASAQPAQSAQSADGEPTAGSFQLDTSAGTLCAPALVVATGGLSIPKIGATDFAYRLAKQFSVKLIEPRPGLVPLTFDEQAWGKMSELAGLSVEVDIEVQGKSQQARFREDMLFTHRGLSGPAILQISNFWSAGETLQIDLAGGEDLEQLLLQTKLSSRQNLAPAIIQALSNKMPRRLVSTWLDTSVFASDAKRKIAELSNKHLVSLALALRRWPVLPTGTEGYRKAEVTLGGVDTNELDPISMQVKSQPGLYFIGEAVDVTGWLGGYNFQWAWASGYGAAMAVTARS